MRRRGFAVVAAVACLVVAGAGQAGAAATAPAGYTIVRGAMMTAPSSPLDTGSDTLCPTGTVAWGGGVAFAGIGGQGETIGTTDPAGSAGWNALVNNLSGSAASFSVHAICAKKPKGYKIVTASAANPSGAQTTATVTCPANTVVLSAGILSESDASSVGMTSLWPASSTKVTGKMLNASSSASTFQVEAVCAAKPARYSIAKLAVTLNTNTILEGGARCPTGTALLGGGVNVASPGQNLVVSADDDGGRSASNVTVTNLTTTSHKVTVYAICAA
jgi:hypothetical protein